MDNVVPVPAAVIHHIDVIQVGVGPVHQLLDHVQRHGGGLLDFVIHQPRPVGAVHVAALHFGRAPVVGEEQHPVGSRVQCVSARIRLCRAARTKSLSSWPPVVVFSMTIITRHRPVMSPTRNLAAPQRPLTCHARSCGLGGKKKHSCLGESVAFLCDSIVSSSKRAAGAAGLAFTAATRLRCAGRPF